MAAPPVQVLKWGIFDVAYEARGDFFAPANSVFTLLWTLPELFTHLWRFLQDVHRIAPTTFVTYVASSAWLGASPAVSLHMSYSILQNIEVLSRHQDIDIVHEHGKLMLTICAWLLATLVSVLMRRFKDDKELTLCGYLRAHFLPCFVQASLKADVGFIHDHSTRRYFPSSATFAEGGPGWTLLKTLAERFQTLISLFSQLIVLLLVLSQLRSWDRWVLGGLIGLFFLVIVFSPSNGVNGAGYTFWTTNNAFNRLHLLYSIIFGDKFRETLVKDGLNDFLSKEYRKCSDDLGVVKSDVITLACVLPPHWYWATFRSLLLDYPMALCALLLISNSSPHIITTLVFFQSATNTLGRTFDCIQRGFDQRSLSQLLAQAQALYKPLDQSKDSPREMISYSPRTEKTGMSLHLEDVTFRYKRVAPEVSTVKNISLFIPAGYFVLLVGENGSGKTTLLKLIARLLEPTSGEILVDSAPLADYDPLSVRKHTTFLMQSEEIFPMSLEENLLMAISDQQVSEEKAQERMDEAIRLGGSQKLIDRVGYDAILNPPIILAQSLQGCGNGVIGEAAVRELERHTSRASVPISNGEKQRFLAARSFMRLLNSDTRLLMVDEPTSSLDRAAERNMFEEFHRLRDGKTTIFVTHLFGGLANHADIIVCMKGGKIVETGRHNELMTLNGEYARLYEAQHTTPSS